MSPLPRLRPVGLGSVQHFVRKNARRTCNGSPANFGNHPNRCRQADDQLHGRVCIREMGLIECLSMGKPFEKVMQNAEFRVE